MKSRSTIITTLEGEKKISPLKCLDISIPTPTGKQAAPSATPTKTPSLTSTSTATPITLTPTSTPTQSMPSGQVWKYYYYAGSQAVAIRVQGDPNPQNNGVFYTLGDQLGSTSVVTDSSGNKVSETRYMPWGEDRYTSGNMPIDHKFTGQREDKGIGLYYYNARWYDTKVGRFTQADTYNAGSIQESDRYAYVKDSPMQNIDPSGHQTDECGYTRNGPNKGREYCKPPPAFDPGINPEKDCGYGRVGSAHPGREFCIIHQPNNTSNFGKDFIAGHEGGPDGVGIPALKPYNDSGGNCTIGYGHEIHNKPCTSDDYKYWSGFTKDDADFWLNADIAIAEKAIHDLVHQSLSQNEFDALVSFILNWGRPRFATSAVLGAINSGESSYTIKVEMEWIVYSGDSYDRGLARRRRDETRLFLFGDYFWEDNGKNGDYDDLP